jgi:sortase A
VRVARVVGGVGRTLIGAGTLILLFVGYQLWGTGIQEARSQRALTHGFERALDRAAERAEPSGGTTTTTEPPLPPPTGEAVAVIEIPRIGVTKTVVEGVAVPDLKKGPGHYPDSPMPGQLGNAAIAGHRTTYGAPFYRLNELEAGDRIRVRTLQGEFDYTVDLTRTVKPDQVEVLAPSKEGRLTLTTCDPRFSARRRLVVSAVLDDRPAPSPTTSTSTTQPRDPSTRPSPAAPVFEQPGLSGDATARWPAFWWGLLTAAAGVATYLGRRRWRTRWAYAIGAPFFFVLLFVFFENVSRLLPANV